MLSNTTTIDGKTILPEIIRGVPPDCRSSSLQWPNTVHPTDWTAWTAWRMLLQHLTTGRRLIQPLGNWIRKPHQNWQWFHDKEADTVYERVESDSWQIYHRHHTGRRQRHPIYGDPEDSDQQPQLGALYPTAPLKQSDGNLRSQPSMTTIPELTLQPNKSLWNPENIPPVFRDTPLFYQCLIGEQPPTQEQYKMISQALGTEG